MQAGPAEIWIVGRKLWYFLHPIPEGNIFAWGPWPTEVKVSTDNQSPHEGRWADDPGFRLLHVNWRTWVKNEPMILDKQDFIRQVLALVNENKDFLIP